ncbi:hypothetical protein RJD39_04720 [Vibrio scophthalmi]|uniref:hypothetical protein n=1 Tax=Vibrio scophthalmi TaxID=45658 RepID=UPI0038738401
MPRINSSGWKSGDLKIHSGTLNDIPNGWELAIDMVDRALVGAGGQYSKGLKFGSDSVATNNRTLSEANGPAHSHSYTAAHGQVLFAGRYLGAYTSKAGFRTSVSGSNVPHNHGNIDTRQKSIAVIWIRKL